MTDHFDKSGDGALPLTFGFGGQIDRVLKRYFDQDAESAVLSWKFRIYYRLRPFIPIFARQLLQRGRNGSMDVPDRWFVHQQFLNDLEAAWQQDCQEPTDRWQIHPWPDDANFANVLTHDVETSRGVELCDRLARLEEEHGFRSAWNFIPHKYKIDPGLIRDLKDRGHEIGVHGYNHDGQLFLSKRKFQRRAKHINAALQQYDSVGFRAPMVHRNLTWMQDLDVSHDASCFDIDPFQAMPGGIGSLWPFIAGKFVELPYTLPQDHTLLIALGHSDISVWQQKLAVIKQWCGMSLLITHPDYLDTEQRLDVYRQWLVHLQSQKNMWSTLPKPLAQWWLDRQQSVVQVENGTPLIVGPAVDRGTAVTRADLLRPKVSTVLSEQTT